ncbi:cation:proton antiporter domain-containing protein [Rickettsia endosymbiont of Cardiosporidium cionae]|uniref:cation:proton antiporter domain-containing protein n=1 Tax=Rickettsia endosymbiont of Cardiosporidium cionae TaxID=2777155 RepID=UPI0018932D3E|nr:cation:proton antiporter [Rickettsia endosymbiont of Cardiosporidium cionae]KAF8818495.1 potassium transporter [Rickettsia endosymbiont of Cardiosporidium cionae]
MENNILFTIIILIAVSVFIVAIFQKLNLNPVFGYLIAGTILGDHGLHIVYFEQTRSFGEFGIVFLLFAIGLELSLERLKAMRRYVFGLGSMQVIITFVVIVSITMLFWDVDHNIAIIIAGGLSLSSTAVVMQVIFEKKIQSLQVGRVAISILLLQDLAVIPLLVIVPFLSNQGAGSDNIGLIVNIKEIIITGGSALIVMFSGRFLLRPLFSFIQPLNNESSELPIAITLLIALSAAAGTYYCGLSLALGGFISGVLVAETDFRNKAAESIEPFKNLLLGLFFMSVGMKIEVVEIYQQFHLILFICLGLIIVKASIITGLCMLFKFNYLVALRTGLLLSQGGEFSFILFSMGIEYQILEENTANVLLAVITSSMALTPLLSLIGEKLVEYFEFNKEAGPLQVMKNATRDLSNHVIIGGFGKVGKLVARVLEAENIHNYAVLDINDEIVNKEKENGITIFKGNILEIDTLEALGIDRAIIMVITMKNEITIKKFLNVINAKSRSLNIIIRLKDLKEANSFYSAGANIIIPQDYELGLQLGNAVLKSVGVSEYEMNRIKKQFRLSNYVGLLNEDSLLELDQND